MINDDFSTFSVFGVNSLPPPLVVLADGKEVRVYALRSVVEKTESCRMFGECWLDFSVGNGPRRQITVPVFSCPDGTFVDMRQCGVDAPVKLFGDMVLMA